MTEIVFATNNTHKLKEVQAILGSAYKVLSLADLNETQDIEETADTLEGNALIKAKFVFDKYKIPCFSDDSGLEVPALNNAPGVHSARFAGAYGDHEKNMSKLLDLLTQKTNRSAHFRTVICYIDDLGEAHYFNGIIEGIITEEKSGNSGFGYDPVFKPAGYAITFAQMPSEEKNAISHRALAIKKFVTYLQSV